MTCDDHDPDTYKICGCAYLEAWELEEQSAHTEAINVLLNHDNVAWLEETRRGKANVFLHVDYPSIDIGNDFLETPDDLLQEDIYDGARKYINSRDTLNMWPERLAIVELAFHIAKPGLYKTTRRFISVESGGSLFEEEGSSLMLAAALNDVTIG